MKSKLPIVGFIIISLLAGFSYFQHEPLDITKLKHVSGTLSADEVVTKKLKRKLKIQFHLNEYGNQFIINSPYSKEVDLETFHSLLIAGSKVDLDISPKYENSLIDDDNTDSIPGVYSLKINNISVLTSEQSAEVNKSNNMWSLYIAIGALLAAGYLLLKKD